MAESALLDHDADWFEDYSDGADDIQIDEYDITSAPNDFNVMTLHSFIKEGSIRIPGFQRNFVWDLPRASKLIESLILGLPVPQMFLYEQRRNEFLVIDGQQRLMSVYYFIERRFPRKERRSELRQIFDEAGVIPEEVLQDDHYFMPFNLRLPEPLPGHPNRFKGLNYSTLGDHKRQFDLRPIRNIVVKRNSPSDDDSSMYEVFNRLNSGGVNLRPQEIRTSMYHSPFYNMLYGVNADQRWRAILQSPQPDLHMKDIEILLRGLAMLIDGDNYAPSMVKFLNQFSRKSESNTADQNDYLKRLMSSFMEGCRGLPKDTFINRANGRFNIALYEATFAAVMLGPFEERGELEGSSAIERERIQCLEVDPDFVRASQFATTGTANVKRRLERARTLLCE